MPLKPALSVQLLFIIKLGYHTAKQSKLPVLISLKDDLIGNEL